MDYILTEHARDVLEKRQIARSRVERALEAPELIEADPVDSELEHRVTCVPEFQNRVLRVIVNTKKTPPRVVTAFFDRRRTLP